jgi:hypothetical protein
MVTTRASRSSSLVRVVALLVLLLLMPGLLRGARGQGQQERVVENVKILADVIEPFGDGFFFARGNVKIGLKDGPPLIKVENTGPIDDPIDPNDDTDHGLIACTPDECLVAGKIGWINDPSPTPLIETGFNDNGIRETLVLLTDFAQLARADTPPEGVTVRNESVKLHFLDRIQMRDFFKNNNPDAFKDIDFTFDLNTKKFTAQVPIALRLAAGADENPDLTLTSVLNWNDQGVFSGSVNGFKARIAGLILSIDNITVKPGEFEAAKADVLKADNPDLPSLDPTNPQVVFSLTKLRYKEGKFSIAGATVPIKDWAFGDAFRMKNQTLGILSDAQTQTLFFTINSTLEFGAVASNPSGVPITLKISRKIVGGVGKPIIEAGLQDISPSLGIMKVNLKGVRLVGDTVENFYGLKADTAELQWPANLGGKKAAGVAGFKLGINKEKQLQFALANGTVSTPEFESGVLKGTLAGTVGLVNETVTFVLSGNLQVKLAGNSGVSTTANITMRSGKNVCPATSQTSPIKKPVSGDTTESCLKRYEESLAAFSIKIAGFGVGLTNARGLEDGGFAADSASLTLPQGLSGLNATINGLVVEGDGDVQIAGGGFELAPLSVGGLQFVGLKGNFVKKSDGSYEFQAGGKMPLPGVEPGANGPGISAAVTIRTTATGNFNGMGVQVTFAAVPGTGLPIGSTGMELTSIGGTFDVNAGTVQIGVTMRASTLARIPPPLNLPLATIDGSATMQINPFLFTTNAKLSVLIFNVASASVKVGHGQGFSGGNGMFVQFEVNGVIIHGDASLRVGKVTVNGVTKNRFAASASLFVGLEKGQFGFLLPPFDINVAGVSFAGGQFKDKRTDPARDTAGLLGTVCVGPFCGSLFADMSKAGPAVDLVNKDKFQLIDSLAVRARAAQGMAGYNSRALTVQEAQAAGLVLAASQINGTEAILQETIPVVITQTTTLVVGVGYQTGDPILRLRLPDNSELTEQTVNGSTQVFVRDTDPISGTTQAFIVGGATPGTYTLVIDNAPAAYQKVAYTLNSPPQVAINTTNCGGDPVAGVTVTCDGNPTGNEVTVGWVVTDTDTLDTAVSIGYVPVPTDTSPIDFTAVQLLQEGQPTGAGSLVWDLSEVPTGQYKVAVIAEDGSNAPVAVYSDVIIAVVDQRPPAVPAGLQGIPQPGELTVRWSQNSELDLAGYEIGFGVVQDDKPDTPENFVYSRNMGPKETITGTNNIVDGKLWGLDDNVDIYYSIRAYDLSGNFSDWAPMQIGKPWPLAPNGWLPTPGSTAVDPGAPIEIAFATPIISPTLVSNVSVTDADGNPVDGELAYITDLEGDKVIGLSLTPAGGLAGERRYTVTVKGGAAGVTAEDGRQMPADYSWTFTTGVRAQQAIFLPLVQK